MTEVNGIDVKPVYRGTIIVDANVLFGFCPDISKSKDGLPPKKFLDILPFLAKNGYHVIIPEMISYEAGEVLASGTSIKSFFPNHSNMLGANILAQFLKSVALGQMPNIEIKSDTGCKITDDFCRQMQDIVNGHSKELTAAKKVRNIKMPAIHACSRTHVQINALHKSMKKDIDYGDEAIVALIAKEYPQRNGKPVFLFTDDNQLSDKIRKDHQHVKKITVSHIIHALHRAGLGSELGFPEIPLREIEAKRREDVAIFSGRDGREPSLNYETPEYQDAVNSSEFTLSLITLAEDLKKQRAAAQANGQDTVNGGAEGNRSDKFRAKFSKFQRPGQNTVDTPTRR